MDIKKYLVITTIALLAHITFAQASLQTKTTLPLQFNTGNPAPYGMPSTVIFIQGKKIPVILDTGAMKSELVLSKHALKNIQVKYTGKNICFHAVDGKYCQPEFILPEVKLGSFTVKNVTGSLMAQLWASNHTQGFKATEASKDGVIGLVLLSKFNLLLDYPNSKALLIKPNAKPHNYNINDWISIPFQDRLLTQLKLNGRTMTFGWDTGAVPSVIKQSVVKEFKQTPCPSNAPYAKRGCLSVVPQSLTTLSGKVTPKSWFRIDDIPSVAPFDGLFGANFFADNQVYFDFDNHLIYVNHV